MQATDYSSLITSEHKDKPNFVAFVELLVSGFVDSLQPATPAPSVDGVVDMLVDVNGVFGGLGSLPTVFDIDNAAGAQLDLVGQLVGLPRRVVVPSLGSVLLEDGDYRQLLLAKLQSNHWDGSMGGFQAILSGLFPGTPIRLRAVDNQDMTMDIYIYGGTPTALQLALLQGGLLVPKPAGVHINGYFAPTGPLFGLDDSNSDIGGLDVGAFSSAL